MFLLIENGRVDVTNIAKHTIQALNKYKHISTNLHTVHIALPVDEANMKEVYTLEISNQEKLAKSKGSFEGGPDRKSRLAEPESPIEDDVGCLEVCKFVIWARDQTSIDLVEKDVTAFCSSETCTKIIDEYSSDLRSMNSDQVNEMDFK